MPVKLLVLGCKPATDLLRPHQLLEFVLDRLEFPEPSCVNRAHRLALFPIHKRAIRAVHDTSHQRATPPERLVTSAGVWFAGGGPDFDRTFFE